MILVNKFLHKTLSHFGYKVVAKKSKADATAELKMLFGTELPIDDYFHCHKGVKLLRALKNTHNASLSINPKQHAEINIKAFRFEINTWEEIFILYEIFVSGIYNLNLTQNFVLIDIGMNVGFTSIYFSSLPDCKKVIAFEPFSNTIEAAKTNMNLNPAQAVRITIHQTGLGYPARSIAVNYSSQYKGSVGINGVASYTKDDSSPVKAELSIADAATSLQPFLAEANLKKVVKMDCEGAEYEIINRLAATGLLSSIDILMLEWHLKGAGELKTCLSNAGFTMFSFNENSSTIGMLYAFKNC